jgi:hypothetical protein
MWPIMPPAKLSPRAGGVNDGLGREGGQGGDAVAVDEDGPVLALLDDHEPRAELQEAFAGGDGVAQAGELLGLVVVEDQAVDIAEEHLELGAGGADPEVHRVGDDQTLFRELLGEPVLHAGVHVGEEDDRAVRVRAGHRGRGLDQDVQLGEERLAVVHVVEVLAAPAEGLGAGPHLEAGRVDA